MENLQKDALFEVEHWNIILGVTCWLLCKCQNRRIVYPNFGMLIDPTKIILWWVDMIVRAIEGLGSKKEARETPNLLCV